MATRKNIWFVGKPKSTMGKKIWRRHHQELLRLWAWCNFFTWRQRGKVFGGGYEIFIVAFFIGLYFNQKRPLIEDTQKTQDFQSAHSVLGQFDSVKGRKAYPKLNEYIFTALVARTDIDFIALEKGEMTSRKAVIILIQTMEEYANWGFHFMEDKLTDFPSYFFKRNCILRSIF